MKRLTCPHPIKTRVTRLCRGGKTQARAKREPCTNTGFALGVQQFLPAASATSLSQQSQVAVSLRDGMSLCPCLQSGVPTDVRWVSPAVQQLPWPLRLLFSHHRPETSPQTSFLQRSSEHKSLPLKYSLILEYCMLFLCRLLRR